MRRLVTRVGEYRMSLAGTCLMAVGLVGVAWAAHQASLPILYSVIPVCVLGFAAVTPSLQSLLSRRSDASEQGGILGVGQGIAAIAQDFRTRRRPDAAAALAHVALLVRRGHHGLERLLGISPPARARRSTRPPSPKPARRNKTGRISVAALAGLVAGGRLTIFRSK